MNRLVLGAAVCSTCAFSAFAGDLAWIEIAGSPSARGGGGIGSMLGDPTLTTGEILDAFEFAAESPSIDGVLVRLKDAELDIAQAEEFADAIKRVRDAGKRVDVFSEIYGTTHVMLAAAADSAIIQAGGVVNFTGLYTEEMYLGDTLGFIGLKADMIQVGDYKGANEQLTRSSPSESWDENIGGLLDGLYGNMRSMVMNGRGLSGDQLDHAMSIAWGTSAENAIKLGLVDRAVDLPAVLDHLGDVYGEPMEIGVSFGLPQEQDLLAGNPLALLGTLMEGPDMTPTGPAIAVVHIDAAIIDGESAEGGVGFGSSGVGSRTIRNALEDIYHDNNFKGVVIRIDSPGGSAIASEVIWQGVRRVAEKKPVWVSIGSMAASGGYYIAVGADKIYANPSSIVGSIGVVGGKITLGGVYGLGRVGVVERSRGPLGNLESSKSAWTNDQRNFVRERMRETYEKFAYRVESGRDGIDLSKVGEGRLFTGSQAIELDMIDEIGTLNDTLDGLSATLGLDEYEVIDFPPPPSLEDVIASTLEGFGGLPGMSMRSGMASGMGGGGSMMGSPVTLQAAAAMLGQRQLEAIMDALSSMMQLQEQSVLLRSPKVFIVR